MLSQIDIYLKNADISSLYSDLGIKLHGFIMSKINTEYARFLHSQSLNPFSIFVFANEKGFVCRISTLTDEAAAQIITKMHTISEINVYGINKPLIVDNIISNAPIQANQISRMLSKRKYIIHFLTPATYKKDGKYCNLPSLYRFFRTVAEKINLFENINIDISDLKTLFDGINITEYTLKSEQYFLNNYPISAMAGNASITITSQSEQLVLLKTLLGYATYSGVGGKTSLGMGGFLVR